MKIIVTTSNSYHHLLPIFFYLYKKYWNEPFDLVGHDKPECELPDNCTWVSLGPQLTKQDWSDQLRPYIETLPDWFVWMFEDTFLKSVRIDLKIEMGNDTDIGRIDLTDDITKREHSLTLAGILAHPGSRYRLSTQPSIWYRDFLLRYLKPNLSPWDFETQDPKHDGWRVLGCITPYLTHNEGVRRFDIHKLNLDGMAQENIDYIKTITDKW